jgi:hypothetical protein
MLLIRNITRQKEEDNLNHLLQRVVRTQALCGRTGTTLCGRTGTAVLTRWARTQFPLFCSSSSSQTKEGTALENFQTASKADHLTVKPCKDNCISPLSLVHRPLTVTAFHG